MERRALTPSPPPLSGRRWGGALSGARGCKRWLARRLRSHVTMAAAVEAGGQPAGQLPSYDAGLPCDISAFLKPVRGQQTLGYFRLLSSLSRDAYWVQGRNMEPRAFVNRYGMILVTHSLMLAARDPDEAEELEQILTGDGMSAPLPPAAVLAGGGAGDAGPSPVTVVGENSASGVYLSASDSPSQLGMAEERMGVGEGREGVGGSGRGGGAAEGEREEVGQDTEVFAAAPAKAVSLKQSLVERLERLDAALDEISELQSRDLYFDTTQESSGDAGCAPTPACSIGFEDIGGRDAGAGEGGDTSAREEGGEGSSSNGGGVGDVVSAVASVGVNAATSTIGFALSMVGGEGDDNDELGGLGTTAQKLEPFMCEWFVADDSTGLTRFFVVEGSDSVDSWKSNLTFEPAQFEGLPGVSVHRGMYDAAQKMYRDFLPLALEHLAKGPEFRLTFTGHSLGGSLGLLLALMMVHRGDVEEHRIADVVSFAGPGIFAEACPDCGGSIHGDHRCACVRPEVGAQRASLLNRVGFPAEKIKNICMGNDIVPRAFSCDYSPVQPILRSLRGSLKDHPSLSGAGGKRPVMFAPVGRTFVLQPNPRLTFVNDDDKPHPMLPPTESLYEITEPPGVGGGHGRKARLFGLLARAGIGPTAASAGARGSSSRGELAAAAAAAGEGDGPAAGRDGEGAPSAASGEPANSAVEAVAEYLNTPHPLTNLADPASYGHHGAISRYHNPRSYFWALSSLLRSAKTPRGR